MDEPPSSPGDLSWVIRSAGSLLLAAKGPTPVTQAVLDGWLVPAVMLLFLLLFLFSGLEAAVLSFGRYRLRELCSDNNLNALKLSRLFKNPERLVSSLVILTTTTNILLVIFWNRGAMLIAENAGIPQARFLIGSDIILFFLIVLLSEITPKTLFTKYAEPISLSLTDIMVSLYWFVIPFAVALEWVAKILLFPFKGEERGRHQTVTEDEIRDIVTVGESEGVIDEHEKTIIHSIIDFGDRQVKEVMVPRIDVVAVEARTPLEEVMHRVVETGYSRIPVYEGSVDVIKGILMTRDILPVIGRGMIDKTFAQDLMTSSLLFVPKTKPLKDLFHEFQRRKIHMAVVIDEHGGTAGIVTTEDMVEEIVGEIADEHDIFEPVIELQEDGSYILEGKTGLYELEEIFNIEIINGDYDTVGGLILAKVGSIPETGQVIEDKGLRFKVLEVEGNRITKLQVWSLDYHLNGGEQR